MQSLYPKNLLLRTRRTLAPAVNAVTELLETRRMFATIQVTTLVDENNGTGALSLREALKTAKNNGATSDQITFAASLFTSTVPQVMNLNSGALVVDSDVSILGPGDDKLIIWAQNRSRIFDINSASVDANIRGVTVTGGDAVEGAAIRNVGNLSLNIVTVVDNHPIVDVSPVLGAGIFNSGDLTLNDCHIQRNTVDGTGFGGGVYNSGTMQAVNCVFDDNSAGEEDGGAICNDEGATASVTSSTFLRNSGDDGGAIHNAGTFTLFASTLTENAGVSGGGFNNFTETAVADIINCTFSLNTADFGGAIAAEGDVQIVNTTIARNSANFAGGGVLGETVIENSIVALNKAQAEPDIFGDFAGSSFSLIGVNSSGSGITNGADGNKAGTSASPLNPQLGALEFNGGPTKTISISSTSPAFNAGSVAKIPNNVVNDQRGLARVVGASVDMGSVEVQNVTDSGQTPFNGPHNIASSGTTRLEAEDFDNGGETTSWHDTTKGNGGGAYRTGVDPDIQTLSGDATGGNFYIGQTKTGEWLEYTVNIASAGDYNLGFRVASAGAGGKFHLEVDGIVKTAQLTIPNTGAWNSWQTVTQNNVTLPAGTHVVRLFLDSVGATGSVGNFNYLTFTKVASTTSTITTTTAAHVRDGGSSNTNFGDATTLDVKKSSTGFNREAYIKFDLSSVNSIGSATLRLFGGLGDTTTSSIELQVLSAENNWTEGGITFNAKPTTTGIRATTTISGTTQKTYDIDLTAFLQAEKAAGRNAVTLVLRSNTSTSTLASFNSDEAASNGPRLIVTT